MKLENEDLINNILTYKSKFQSNCDTYRDTMDGDLYRSIDGLRDSSNLSIQFNVDGIPLYRKSKYDIWPIQVIINELEPLERKKKYNDVCIVVWLKKTSYERLLNTIC